MTSTWRFIQVCSNVSFISNVYKSSRALLINTSIFSKFEVSFSIILHLLPYLGNQDLPIDLFPNVIFLAFIISIDKTSNLSLMLLIQKVGSKYNRWQKAAPTCGNPSAGGQLDCCMKINHYIIYPRSLETLPKLGLHFIWTIFNDKLVKH